MGANGGGVGETGFERREKEEIHNLNSVPTSEIILWIVNESISAFKLFLINSGTGGTRARGGKSRNSEPQFRSDFGIIFWPWSS